MHSGMTIPSACTTPTAPSTRASIPNTGLPTPANPNGFTSLTAIDIIGHEMTHGVTANTAGMIDDGETGGLNEGTSDIMG